METKEIILRSLKQSEEYLTRALNGLTQGEFSWSPREECNSIAFILWHTVRVEDFFMQRVIQRKEVLYESEGWWEKLGTPANESGYGYTAEQLKNWSVPELGVLKGYTDSVRKATLTFLETLTPERLDEVLRPDRSPDSIVGVILCRMMTEIALHMGQIAYLRGLQRGLDK